MKIDTNGYTIKNLKTWNGMDWGGYTCVVMKDGRQVCDVLEEGNGGEPRFIWQGGWEGKDAMAMKEHCRKLGKYPQRADDPCKIELDWDCALFVEHLVSEYEVEKRLRRLCKTKTLIRLKGDEEDAYRQYTVGYSPAVAQKIREKHGEALEEILNERYLKAGVANGTR